MQATWTGSVSQAQDNFGLFGAPSGGLNGLNYTMNFVYDTALGGHFPTATSDTISGGTDFGRPTPLISASLTLNGKTISVPGLTNVGINQSVASNGLGTLSQFALDYSTALNGSVTYHSLFGTAANLLGGNVPVNLAVPFAIPDIGAASSVFAGSNQFIYLDYDGSTGAYVNFARGLLIPTSFTVSAYAPTAAVPLPASALMLWAGVVAIGVVRRRKQTAWG